MKVIFSPEVREYMREVSYIMYEKEYFSFRDSSEKYMEDLIHEIITTLPHKQVKVAPPFFDQYAKKMLYSMFRKSRSTQWYVFFNLYQGEQEDEYIYLVRYISNNHVISHHL